MDLKNKILEILKDNYLCENCLGRLAGNLLSGYSNEERGKIIRTYLAMLIDSGEKIQINPANLYGIKFRNVKIETVKPDICFVCKNFFITGINEVVNKIFKRIEKIEFDTFLIGSVLNDDMLSAENYIWERIGIESVESIKSEINREVGKRIEKITGKKSKSVNPDLTILVDLKNNKISVSIRSLYIKGSYKKLIRGIPQSKWLCVNCNGKGCIKCKGKGKLYPTSVQEIIEKPLLKATKGNKSYFHAEGREDINVRCLAWRPFIIEISKPLKRFINLREIERNINKSKKVKVKGLTIIQNGKEEVRRLKTERVDKTYLAEITFYKKVDRNKLKELKNLTKEPIVQRTPLRVLHRRKDKFRKRLVKKVSWKIIGDRKILLKVRAESGLYIKELITGDEGRTKPNVAEILDNKIKKINLDVIKIHN
jgi:tRNA pseudouridine synthase 10